VRWRFNCCRYFALFPLLFNAEEGLIKVSLLVAYISAGYLGLRQCNLQRRGGSSSSRDSASAGLGFGRMEIAYVTPYVTPYVTLVYFAIVHPKLCSDEFAHVALPTTPRHSLRRLVPAKV
jgi:hypothetical protein